MKTIKYLIVLLISMFSFSLSGYASSSNFEAFMTMDTDITENQVRVALGFAGEEIMTIKQNLTYDANKFSLVEVEALDNFNVTTSGEENDGKYRTIKILADSDYSFTESNYAILVFEVKKDFKNKNKSDIFLYNYEASGPEKIKYRSKGFIATLNRVSISEMNFTLNDIKDSTKTKYWLLSHIYIFVIVGIAIVGLIVFILLLPSKRKKEIREKTTEEAIKPENYDPSLSNIKIDREKIDAIGRVEKPIDMSQAIIVNEDIKPFGDIIGKFDEQEEKTNPTNSGLEQTSFINVFENRTPLSMEENALAKEEIKDTKTSVNGFDPFNATIIEGNENAEQKSAEKLETLDELPTLKSETNQNKEGLTVISPTSFDTVEIPKLNEDIKLEPKENHVNNDNKTNLPIVFLLISCSILTLTNVFANENSYQVPVLRECIVGKVPCDKALDYNQDGVIDILDIVETKDLTNCSFENLLSSDPGFKELYGQSNNLISSDSNFVAPTKKTKPEKTTTTKRPPSNNTSSSGGSNNTTTKKGTLIRTTKYTTKATTEKPQANTYQVQINSLDGSASPSSFELQAGKSKSVVLTPKEGYTLDENNSGCKNASYAFSSSTKLMIANITGNATCTIKFVPSNNVKVTLSIYTGNGKSNTINPDITYSAKTINNGGTGVYNQKWSTGVTLPTGYKLKENPSCGSYNNGVFSITIPASSITCKMYFDPIMYDFKVYLNGQSSPINTGTLARIFYGEKKKVEFESYSEYKNLTCPNGSATRLVKTGNGPYHYYFYYTHNKASTATCTIS